MNMSDNTFGERLRLLRNEKELTQESLANEFNKRYGYSFTKSTFCNYENNTRKPEMKVFTELAEFFDVSVDYLLCLSSVKTRVFTNPKEMLEAMSKEYTPEVRNLQIIEMLKKLSPAEKDKVVAFINFMASQHLGGWITHD